MLLKDMATFLTWQDDLSMFAELVKLSLASLEFIKSVRDNLQILRLVVMYRFK